jgi:hypothetical protein
MPVASIASGLSVDRDARNGVRPDQGVEVIDDFLRPADCERGYDDATAARGRLANDGAEPLAHVDGGRVVAIAVRRLQNDRVRAVRRIRVANDRQPLSSYVTAEHEPHRSTVLRALEQHRRGAENMAGVGKSDTNAGHDVEWLTVGRHSHQFHERGDVALPIQGRGEGLSVAREILCVLLLQVSGIDEHDRAEVARCGRAVHGAAVSLGGEEW